MGVYFAAARDKECPVYGNDALLVSIQETRGQYAARWRNAYLAAFFWEARGEVEGKVVVSRQERGSASGTGQETYGEVISALVGLSFRGRESDDRNARRYGLFADQKVW